MAEKQKKPRKPKPDHPDLGPEEMQNPFPPHYGAEPHPLDQDTVTAPERQKKRRKPKPDQPDLGPEEMQNPFPPQYGAQPPPPLDQNTVTLQNVQQAPALPLQMTPREPEGKPDPDYEYDMYKLGPHVEISFDETFAEPGDGAMGLKCTTVVNKAIYKCAHIAVYACLAMIIGPIMTFMCGITFALNHIIIVWMVQPCIKLSFVWFRIVNIFFTTCVRMFNDPCYKSAALLFSEIKGRFRVDTSDITLNMKTGQIQHV